MVGFFDKYGVHLTAGHLVTIKCALHQKGELPNDEVILADVALRWYSQKILAYWGSAEYYRQVG